MAAMWREILSSKSEELNAVAQELGIHPLALEDCIHRDQRPKLEDFDSHQFLVWFMVWGTNIYELQFVIFPDQIIFVPHEGPPEGNEWKEFFRISGNHKDVWHMLYQVLDRSTDCTTRATRNLFEEFDNFEQEIFQQNGNPQLFLTLKKKLNVIDYSVGHLASVAEQLQRFYQVKDDLVWKWRDLRDHCERTLRDLTLYRSQISTAIELYWGHQASRSNHQIKRMSLLASIALPLTFWASFWGMNFTVIPFDSPALFIGALIVMVSSVLAAAFVLVKRGYWID